MTQAAVSHQVKALEERFGIVLFRRLPRGLALTDEGRSLLPTLQETFDRLSIALDRFQGRHSREVLHVGVVGTFALGWLLPRLGDFEAACPHVDLRLTTNNNRVDIATEGLDFAIRFGGGAWHLTEADRLVEARLSPLCRPEAAARLDAPEDLRGEVLLRSYRADEWELWSAAAGIEPLAARGPVFDSSLGLVEAALLGAGIALVPVAMFPRHRREGALVQPFQTEVAAGSYWLTRLQSSPLTAAMTDFRTWILATAAGAR
ncbi:LysR substrate-binding domain-containing protein [Prosthecomicrobium sp. N25]